MRPLGRPFKRATRSGIPIGERQESLRKLVFNNTGTGRIDFDILCDRVLANMPENWTMFTVRRRNAHETGKTKGSSSGRHT